MGLKPNTRPSDAAVPIIETGSSVDRWVAWMRAACLNCGHPRADHMHTHDEAATLRGDLNPYPCDGGRGWFCGCGGHFEA